jgi:hypothetical protein
LSGLSFPINRYDGTACCDAKIIKTWQTLKIAIFAIAKKALFEEPGGR